jgi:hypothetical protein
MNGAEAMTVPNDGEIYLGDGAYVSRDRHDPLTIWLRAPRVGGDHLIGLDPQAWIKLEQFVASIWPRQRRAP